jgi:hypothetical protein
MKIYKDQIHLAVSTAMQDMILHLTSETSCYLQEEFEKDENKDEKSAFYVLKDISNFIIDNPLAPAEAAFIYAESISKDRAQHLFFDTDKNWENLDEEKRLLVELMHGVTLAVHKVVTDFEARQPGFEQELKTPPAPLLRDTILYRPGSINDRFEDQNEMYDPAKHGSGLITDEDHDGHLSKMVTPSGASERLADAPGRPEETEAQENERVLARESAEETQQGVVLPEAAVLKKPEPVISPAPQPEPAPAKPSRKKRKR